MTDETSSLKQGTVRADGLVFWARDRKRNSEYWITKEKFELFRERKNERLRSWRKKHHEKVREEAKVYRLNSLDKCRERNRLWSERNRKRVAPKLKAWKQENKARCCYVEEQRRARKLAQTPKDSWESVVLGFFEISERVSRCLQIRHAVDHIYPLSKGGSHCHRNLQVLPFSLNSRKSARLKVDLPNCYRTDGFWFLPKAVEV
jgi:hypothetical protein